MNIARIVRLLGLLLGLGALVLQFSLSIPEAMAKGRSLPDALIFFFSFFTILTNLLVVTCYAALLFGRGRWAQFFAGARTQSAALVYIAIVATVYAALLRHSWSPGGLWMLADEALHTICPLLFALHWMLFVPKGRLSYWSVPFWQIWPSIYLAYVMARGALTGIYPYAFLDAGALGYLLTAKNIAIMIAFSVLLSLGVIAVDRLIARAKIAVH